MKLQYKALTLAVVAAAIGAPFLTSPAGATTKVHLTFAVPVHSSVSVTAFTCDNHGPTVTITGNTAEGGSALQFTFENNVKGTHTYTVIGASSGLSILDSTNSYTTYKQPTALLNGTGGNPYVYIVDQTGTWNYVGRCIQDGFIGDWNHGPFVSDFSVGGAVDLAAVGLTCGSQSSTLGINTTSTTDSVTGYLAFANNYVGLKGVTPLTNITNVMATAGFTLAGAQSIPKGWNQGGPGGNPLVLAGLGTLDSAGTFVSDGKSLSTLGRCNKL